MRNFGKLKTVLAATLLLLMAADVAEARKKRYYLRIQGLTLGPAVSLFAPGRRSSAAVYHRESRSSKRSPSLSELIPVDWTTQPSVPEIDGKRFVSPDGQSWFAAYRTAASTDAHSAHMKSVAFADGETVTYLRGERDWLAVSGMKQDRIFYRKAVLSCGGTAWHHIAFEYPLGLKLRMDRFVTLAGRALENTRNECS